MYLRSALNQRILDSLDRNDTGALAAVLEEHKRTSGVVALELQLYDYLQPSYPPSIIDAHNIPGLILIPNYLSLYELARLEEQLVDYPLTNTRGIEPRRVYYGQSTEAKYYKTPALLKGLLSQMQKRAGTNLTRKSFNQVCVTEYKPKQQRSFCIDSPQIYGNLTACFVIGLQPEISFKLGTMIKHIKIDSRTLCILTGAARYEWCYSIKNNTNSIKHSIIFRSCDSPEDLAG